MASQFEIGQYIQKQRKSLGFTQKELASKLGISFQAVSKWENGETLPDTGTLLELAELLNTTTDKILSGGGLVIRKGKSINVLNIVEGLSALENLKHYFGEKSTLYTGAIEGINKKMNIDFESYINNETYKKVFLIEVIIQFLMDGYSIEKNDIDLYVKSEKMRNIIYKYIGNESNVTVLAYMNNVKLFEQIRRIRKELGDITELNLLPGEYLRLDKGKNYWCTQVEINSELCLGVAVDDYYIHIFSYKGNGEDQQLIHEEKRQD